MKKGLFSLFLFCFVFTSGITLAQEPTNLTVHKQQLVDYYDSGEYLKDVDSVIDQAISYLKTRLGEGNFNGKKPAIILDIDETSLSNYPNMRKANFGGTIESITQAENEGKDPALTPTLKLYRFAVENKVSVFFVTGRKPTARAGTVINLRNAGYSTWAGLFFKPADYNQPSNVPYKVNIRKELTDLGYNIVLNVGDQDSDLTGGYAEKSFKLPNPYYTIR